jgi:phosphopantetheinyl transferase (holo-ACP synthase)
MNIVGHDIDIVEISPLKKLLERREVHFETRCFTDAELISAAESGVSRVQPKESYMTLDML